MSYLDKPERLKVDGLILAGGQSVRMGEDKAQLQVNGEALLQYHIGVMQGSVDVLFVADNADAAVPVSGGVVHLKDKYMGSEGPLSGLLAALECSESEFLWVMSCDNYGLPKVLLSQLKESLIESGADVACLKIAGRHQPLISLMRCHLDKQLAVYMATGARAVLRWYDCLDVVDVELAADGFWCNINTQEDYQALLASL